MTDELLSCPLCYGEVELVLDHTVEQIDWIKHKGRYCGLDFCGERGTVVSKWNWRPTESNASGPSQELLERVTQALEARATKGPTLPPWRYMAIAALEAIGDRP